MPKYKVVFNAVIETEIKLAKEVELSYDEVGELINYMIDSDPETKTISIDEVKDDLNEELHDMMLSLVPDELKKNCVSMAFTDIQATLIDNF